MSDERLDELIASALPDTPPDAVAGGVTPWRRAMTQVLWGLGLSSITFNFYGLNYILPAIGHLLMLCGFRTLRRENRWFSALYVTAVLRLLAFFAALVQLSMAIDRDSLPFLPYILSPVQMLQPLLLWGGIRGIQAKAGLKPHAASAIWLFVWYVSAFLLGLSGASLSIIYGVIFVVVFALIIVCLNRLSKALDEAGYAVTAAPGRVSNLALTLTIAAVTAVLMICACLLTNRYPMDWQPVEDPGQAETRAELLELGFPEQVLADLTDEDAAKCAGALRVVYMTSDEYFNDGREVREEYTDESGVRHIGTSTVYDVRELRATGVAVELPGGRWMVFHHFQWVEPVPFYGTESVQIWTADRMRGDSDYGWSSGGEPSGRVLYDEGGQSMAADYYYLGRVNYTSNSIFYAQRDNSDVFAAYSAPLHAENVRGYVAYPVVMREEGWIFDSWMNYTHQQTPLQFPAYTAMQMRMQNAWNKAGAFLTVQTALQFHPSNGEHGLID